MPDKYPNFDVLSRKETIGIDFRISVRAAKDVFAIVAPHGGGIEPGTSEIADAIAAQDFSFYAFEGLKSSENSDLHITSTRFDEPLCRRLIRQCDVVLTVHGEGSDAGVFIGGRDADLGQRLDEALTANGFEVRQPGPGLEGLERRNLCNRGRFSSGVQLELSRGLRQEMFLSLSREGRKETTPRFHAFVDTVRSVLAEGREARLTSCHGSGG
jgi:phage replication-related protein YjqB (UPF0714/DUF867 family)